MEVIINGTKEKNNWVVEAGDIVTEKDNRGNNYYIIIEVEEDDFMVANLDNPSFKKFETTNISFQEKNEIEDEYVLVKKHNDVKVTFSW